MIPTEFLLPGADIASGPVWMEYIAFLKSLPVCSSFSVLSDFHNLFSRLTSINQLLLLANSMLFMLRLLQASNAQEESLRMTAVRKAYQKAIVTPTHHIEQLWKDYENFENSVSRQLVTL